MLQQVGDERIRMIGLPGFKYHALLTADYTFNPQMTQIWVRAAVVG